MRVRVLIGVVSLIGFATLMGNLILDANLSLAAADANNSWNWVRTDAGEFEDDLLVVALWSAMGVFGLVTNLLILAGILHNRKLNQSTSYWLIISLSVCDISMIIVCLGHLVPATLLHTRYVSLIDFSNAFGIFVYDAFWYAGVLHLMAMSLNRYVNICKPKYYLRLFSRRKTVVIICCLYCAGVVVAVPGLFSCCYLIFNHYMYAAHYANHDTPYTYLDLSINGASIVVMTFCYSCIVVRVRRSRIMLQQYRKLCMEQRSWQTKTVFAYASSDRAPSKFARLLRPNVPIISRREIRLFFQFATVSGIFFVTSASWGWLPRLSESKWVGFVVTSLFFVNNSTNPTVYLMFNSVLRRQIQKVFCPFRTATEPLRFEQHAYCGQRPGLVVAAGVQQTSALMLKLNDSRRRRRRRRPPSRNGNVPDIDVCSSGGNSQDNHRPLHGANSTALDREDGRLTAGRRRRRSLSHSFDFTNEQSELLTADNATCNLMAMAAFLNTTTITGSVLMNTAYESTNGTPRSETLLPAQRKKESASSNSQSIQMPLLELESDSLLDYYNIALSFIDEESSSAS